MYAVRRVIKKTGKIVFHSGFSIPTIKEARKLAGMITVHLNHEVFRVEILQRVIRVVK